MNCNCQSSGECQYAEVRTKGGRLFDICRGNALEPARQSQYRAIWAAKENGQTSRTTINPAWPCSHRGEERGLEVCQTCSGFVQIKAFSCRNAEIPEQRCTISKPIANLATCATCDRRVVPDETSEWQWVSYADMVRDSLKLAGELPPDIDAIAGVPRSGIVPAAIVAQVRNIPLWEISKQHGLRPLGRGGRGGDVASPKKLVVLDDTAYSGVTMRNLTAQHAPNAIKAVLYARPDVARSVDYYARELPAPHLVEWHLFNSGLIDGRCQDYRLWGGIALDFDGVICEECPLPENDTSENQGKYLEWIDTAVPKFLPRMRVVPLVVTFRYHWARERTMAWLQKYGVKVGEIVFSSADSYSDRTRMFDVAEHKGKRFKESPCGLFIESSDWQARVIHEASGKPVVGLDTGKIYQ